ncbi:hypothetical protein [Pedobacter metabolipauper]|uniref:PepSY-like beta-lactamase-inhibitor n=1 Tax=Pedobacter metabolipauper TaxID=425513 RepID=A0A4R6STF9_9SPHI|nr:hypothetical protein [Pedobacter metabolipauper]TDQ08298.1 hypothetical protein ATK78_2807 [Pedobacter metabolipauper]
MKYLVLLLVLVSANGFAQKKSAKKAPAKKIYHIPPAINPPKEEPETTPMFPQAFAWQINADTTLAANVVFREIIEISGNNVNSRASHKEEPVTLKRSKEKDYNVEEAVRSSITTQLKQYNSMLVKDFLTLTDKDTKAERKFKLFYDQDKNIIRLQDVKTKKFYESTHFEGGSPSM